MKYRFVRYKFVRHWFRFLSRPWINTDILVNILSPRRLEDVLKKSWRHLARRLQDVFKTYLLRWLIWLKLLLWRRVEDVLKACFEDVFKTSWRPTNVFWVISNIKYIAIYTNTLLSDLLYIQWTVLETNKNKQTISSKGKSHENF